MFLRSLQVRGFKSFADRTVLELAPGISVIVGPNGSGKSNLVDAIAWVLGEQGPRALRGGQMADVIFAGSPGRAALGMAEVTLVIDNEAGLIPVPDAEIEVGRVVYRSGESEYLLAGKPVRLLDIQELLSDTGIGRALHTVVGQGQLEDVLIARPEERRQFIEEAAGIAKHRRRKERAVRKLARLDQDLVRLQDVMAELKRRLRPLKQQAEAASKHEALSAEADSLASRLAAARLRDLYREREARRPGWERGQAARREAEERLTALDTQIALHTERLGTAEAALAAAEETEARASEARTSAEAALREAVRAEGDARARAAADAGRSGRLFSLEEDARRTEASVAEAVRALEEGEAALAEAEHSYAEAEHQRRRAEEVRRVARDRAVARRAEALTVRRSLDISRSERDRLASELSAVLGREEEARTRRAGIESEIERLDSGSGPGTDRLGRLAREAERLEVEISGLEAEDRRLDARLQALVARREALGDTPGRRLLGRTGGRAIGLLSGLIDVERGWEAAVGAALGPLVEAVVYADHGTAVSDAVRAEGATLAVAEDAPGTFVLPGERSLLSVVRADPRAAAAVKAALRHVYVAVDAAEALAKHRRHPGASFVSKDGVLVGPAVVRTAPARGGDADRREEVDVEGDLGRVRKELASRREALDRAAGERAAVEETLRRSDEEITAAAARMAALDADLAALVREREVLEARLGGVDRSIRDATAALGPEPEQEGAEVESSMPRIVEPPIAIRVEVEALRRERDRLESALAGTRTSLGRLRDEDPEANLARAETAAAERERAEAALSGAERGSADATRRREEAAAEVAEVRAAEAEANRAWRTAAAGLQRLRDEYEDEEQARRDVDRRVEEAERVLREGHHADPARAVAALSGEDTPEALRKRSDLVARRLALLGRVNLVATEEFRELRERHDFLQREIEDVRAARRDLQEVVREVDRKVVEIFDAAFRDVAGEFAALFSQLFPGGEGKLTLTEPGDLLTTGIDIEARPGRKRVKRLSLLSGGERALTALGFLFAIFRARPSPFYLLDEVEAALDDVNLHRFLELIRGFAGTSQVILVTHQKRTMEAADVLYGVSMGKDGASSVISQRVSDAVTTAR